MKCPTCGTTTYASMGGLEICPKCGYGSPNAKRREEARPPTQVFRHGWKPPTSSPTGSALTVDNRVLVLGLDKLYRDAMKGFEETRLLACAEKVAATLKVAPAQVPIEGYYTESPALREYFQRMRALQAEDESRERVVRHLPEFRLLWDVTSSPLYGRPQRHGKLLPVGRDPLAQALPDTHWSVADLVKATYAIALQQDDCSLVGLAARTQDAVLITATRESVVLYAEVVWGIHEEPEFEYEWGIDQALAEAANRFVETFNSFVPGALPRAIAANAETFYKAYADNAIVGRCVRIGQTREVHYHWAIATRQVSGDTLELCVDEFWSDHVWTTEKYREAQGSSSRMRLFQTEGMPEGKEGWL